MKLLNNIDKSVFGFGVIIYLVLFAFIFFLPDIASVVISNTLDFTLNTTGWIYVLIYIFIYAVFLFLGLSRYGKMRLGPDDSKPKYSFFSWMAMLICCGLGVGLVFFGVSEPVTHFIQSPYAESGSVEAARDAIHITYFHWGIMPWSIYGMVGLCMAYFTFRKGLPALVSSSFAPMVGYENTRGRVGRVVDTFALIATVCGTSMSLGFAAVQFSAGLKTQYGIEDSFLTICFITILIGGLAMTSSIKGIDKGIKVFSNANMYLIIFFLIFAFIFGAPAVYLIEIFIEGMGDMISGMPDMITFMDAYGTAEANTGYNWFGGWTIMYWAWWIAFAPFVGGFLADISKGRTVREFVFACTLVPGIVCCLWFAAYGGGAIYLDLFQGADIAEAIVADTNNSLFIFLKELPFSAVSLPVSMVLIIILIVTSVDSATFVAGSFCSKGALEPSTSIRAFWCVFVIITSIAFLLIGGLTVLKQAAIVLAFPFALIMVLMTINLLRDMKKSMTSEK